MKFKIQRETFLEGMQQVQHVVSPRTTLPILSNVLIEAVEGGLRLTTSDLDMGVSVDLPAEVIKEGSTTLPARKLASIVRELPGADVAVEVSDKDAASIRSGASYFRILGLNRAEFPKLPTFEEASEFRLDQAILADSLKKTSYAISTDETRFVLNGVYVSFRNNAMTMVATDGRRLAVVEREFEFPESQAMEVIIPSKAVNELQRLVGTSGQVVMRLAENKGSFEFGKSVLVTKLIEGNFPNYRQVIPEETKHRITLEREKFHEIVNRVSLLASDKSSSIVLAFSKDLIEVSANSPDVGESQETIPVSYKGEEMKIAFNPEFLLAPLRNVPADEIHLDLINEMSPGVLRTDDTFLYVLMPMRVN
jgi:DNA polymerase III subunit beta